MAHHLAPREDDDFLTPEEVVKRLCKEFKYLWVDKPQGAQFVRGMINHQKEWLRKRLRYPAELKAKIAELESAMDRSYYVTVSARRNSRYLLQTCVMPKEPIFFGYRSGQYEDAVARLLTRFARCLQYEITLL